VTLNSISANEPIIVGTLAPPDDPNLHPIGNATIPKDPNAVSEAPAPPPQVTAHPSVDFSTLTTNPLDVGYVDTPDPTVVILAE
jgi:hypothetical protein